MDTSFPPIVLRLKTIRMPHVGEMCKKNPEKCCKCLVRYASPSIYNNSYPLLTHSFLQFLNSFIPFLPNINILTRGVRCMFRFPKFLQKAVDSYNDALYNSKFAFVQEFRKFIVIKSLLCLVLRLE